MPRKLNITMKHSALCTIAPLSILMLVGCTTPPPTIDQTSYALEASYVVIAHTEVAVLPTLSALQQATIRQFDAQAYAAVVNLRQSAQEGTATVGDIETTSSRLLALSDALKQEQSR